jgi:hypothetical protein
MSFLLVIPARMREYLEGCDVLQKGEPGTDPLAPALLAAWEAGTLYRGNLRLTLEGQPGLDVVGFIQDYAETITSAPAGDYDRGERRAALQTVERCEIGRNKLKRAMA